jgi:hypothetical protein
VPFVYRVSDRAGSWPMLTREPRQPGPDCPVQVELVAETDDETAAWDTFDRLADDLEGRGPDEPDEPFGEGVD